MLARLLPIGVFGAAIVLTPSTANANCPVPGFQYGAFADSSLKFSGGSFVDSYDSSAGTFAGTHVSAGGNVGTNSTVAGSVDISGAPTTINGNVEVGVGGTPGTVITGGGAVTGTETALTSPVTLTPVIVPTLPDASPLNPSGSALNLASGLHYTSVNCNNNPGSTLVLNAGTYVIDSLTVQGNCTLSLASVPVTVFVRTTLDLSGSTTNPSLKATDLVFMGADTLTTVKINSAGTSTSFGLYAPNADITITGSADFYGAIVGKSVKDTGGAVIHYDKALASFTSAGLTCGGEVSRATPVVATIDGSSCVVQGSFEFGAGAATTIAVPGDVANFVFPFTQGHMRARTTASVQTAQTGLLGDTFSQGTIVFDAAVGIPPADFGGCGAAAGGGFLATCRNVFTNTNSTPASGTTFHPATLALTDGNSATIGNLIAPDAIVSGITAANWTTLVQRVLVGTAGGTISKLGGVDRSTVAVIEPSTLAGSATRPTMAYFGGADGMLHAVCASTGGDTASATNICPSTLEGTELWAFLPRVELPLIRVNKAKIDGSVRVVDAFGDFTTAGATGKKTWHTILTFQTGFNDTAVAGAIGPATYAIDITDPAKPVVLWEYVTPGTPSADGFDLGVGLAMHAGASLVSGAITNLAVAATSNGGTGADGLVVNALSLELGTPLWKFGFTYPKPPRTIALDDFLSSTGVPGGAVGVDMTGSGFVSDIVVGDLYGDLWKLNAATGASSTGSATTPLFSFASNKHPIGSLPAIFDNGTKVAAFASGAYADTDPASTLWSGAGQRLIAVPLLPGTAPLDDSSGTLVINLALTGTEATIGQLLVVGDQLFLTTDTSNINSASYGTTGATTGHAYSVDLGTPTLVAVGSNGGVIQGGGSGLVNDGTSIYGGAADLQQRLGSTATSATGTTVDYNNTKKPTRLVWLETAN